MQGWELRQLCKELQNAAALLRCRATYYRNFYKNIAAAAVAAAAVVTQ